MKLKMSLQHSRCARQMRNRNKVQRQTALRWSRREILSLFDQKEDVIFVDLCFFRVLIVKETGAKGERWNEQGGRRKEEGGRRGK